LEALHGFVQPCFALVASGLQKIRDEHGEGSTAVESGYDADADALAGMAEKSAEFAAQGNRVYLPLAD
jgi:phosphomethylpyrimidine synthase